MDVLTEAGFIERDKQGKIVLTPRGKLLTNLISVLSRIKQMKFTKRPESEEGPTGAEPSEVSSSAVRR